MDAERHRPKLRKALWTAALAYLALLLFPIENHLTRFLSVAGLFILSAGVVLRGRPTRLLTIPALVLAVALFCLPGRPATLSLRTDYCAALRLFRHTPYVWGGENLLGVDCSGLVRQGMVWAQLANGLRTGNGTLLRGGLWLWGHDCSARDLGQSWRGQTQRLFSAESLNVTDYARLLPGDLAVTSGGVHVLVYLGEQTWYQADPGYRNVLSLTVPNRDGWFKEPVVLLRWTVLGKVGV